MNIAVVGRGLIGSAAARHLAEAGADVTLYGPPEPTDWHSHLGPFASHYDSGRITRIIANDPVWAELATRSIARYRDIESASGIEFYRPVGCLVSDPDLLPWAATAPRAELVRPEEALERFGIAIPHAALYEAEPGGHIDPRRLVAAQVAAAQKAGARLVERAQTDLPTADRVLVAAGAFSPDLIGPLAVTRFARTVVLAETDRRPELPSLIVKSPNPECDGIYWVPPTDYPDGRIQLKIGGTVPPSNVFAHTADIRTWFKGDGAAHEIAALQATMLQLLPDLEVSSWDATPCVITETDSGYPYIGALDDVGPNVFVAAGGNGSAAKSSDELGRLAARLVLDGRWTDPLDSDHFVPRRPPVGS